MIIPWISHRAFISHRGRAGSQCALQALNTPFPSLGHNCIKLNVDQLITMTVAKQRGRWPPESSSAVRPAAEG